MTVRSGGTAPIRGAARVTPRNVPLAVGSVVGPSAGAATERWRVLRYLSDGGFSSVYAVRPASPETADRYGSADRGLKCLWGTPAEITAIRSEADTMAAVSGHENVVGLVSHFRFGLPDPEAAAHHPGEHFLGIVLELADEDLYGVRHRCRPSDQVWAAVFEQVAAGLAHVHERRVVHGDIKPTNVLRIGGRLAVADFGVSAPLDSTRSAGIGLARTLPFWPPESGGQGMRAADGRRLAPAGGWRASQSGDVWALAVSMHRVLTGNHICPGTTPEEQYEMVCAGRYGVDSGLARGWRELLQDCLAYDPDRRRISTAADLRRRLAELAEPPGVPWGGGPLVVGVLATTAEAAAQRADEHASGLSSDEEHGGDVVVLSLSERRGRVTGAVVPSGAPLLDAVRHAYTVAMPALIERASAAGGLEDAVETRVVSLERPLVPPVQPAALAPPADELDRLMAERDALAAERDQATAERDRLAREVSRLGHEHAKLITETAQDDHEQYRLRDQVDRLRSERDKSRKEAAKSERERTRLTRQVAELTSQRPAQPYPYPAGPPTNRPWRPGVPPPQASLPARRKRRGCLTSFMMLFLAFVVGAIVAAQVVQDDGEPSIIRRIVRELRQEQMVDGSLVERAVVVKDRL